MRPVGSASELEARRRLAVRRVKKGETHTEVATALGVSPKAVGNWMAAYRASGEGGLKGKPHPGATPKLQEYQERQVVIALAVGPRVFGYKTDRWTARQLAEMIALGLTIRFNVKYMAAWMTQRGYSPQRPGGLDLQSDDLSFIMSSIEFDYDLGIIPSTWSPKSSRLRRLLLTPPWDAPDQGPDGQDAGCGSGTR
jgi:transposase